MPAVSEKVADAVKAVVAGLSLTPTPTVVKRKRPAVVDKDTLPLIVVAVGDTEEFEPLASESAGKLTWLVGRPLAVAIAFKAGGKVGENSDLRTMREAIWPAVTRGSLTAVGTDVRFNDVKPRGEPIFDGARLQDGYDWSVLSLTVETLEEKDY